MHALFFSKKVPDKRDKKKMTFVLKHNNHIILTHEKWRLSFLITQTHLPSKDTPFELQLHFFSSFNVLLFHKLGNFTSSRLFIRWFEWMHLEETMVQCSFHICARLCDQGQAVPVWGIIHWWWTGSAHTNEIALNPIWYICLFVCFFIVAFLYCNVCHLCAIFQKGSAASEPHKPMGFILLSIGDEAHLENLFVCSFLNCRSCWNIQFRAGRDSVTGRVWLNVSDGTVMKCTWSLKTESEHDIVHRKCSRCSKSSSRSSFNPPFPLFFWVVNTIWDVHLTNMNMITVVEPLSLDPSSMEPRGGVRPCCRPMVDEPWWILWR